MSTGRESPVRQPAMRCKTRRFIRLRASPRRESRTGQPGDVHGIRYEDDRRADDDPDQVLERMPHTEDRTHGDQADRCGAGGAHDREREEQERRDRSPPNRRDGKRLRHCRRDTVDSCRRRYEAPMLTVLNDPAARRSDSIRFGPSAYGVERAEVYISTRGFDLTGTTPTGSASRRPARTSFVTAARSVSACPVSCTSIG